MILDSKRRTFGGSGGGGSISRPKKPKRPLGGEKMSSKSSGIGIGTLLFWGFIAWSIFGGDDDADEKKKATDTATNSSIEETVETTKKTIIKIGDGLVVKINDVVEKVEGKVISEGEDASDEVIKLENEEIVVAKSQKKQNKRKETKTNDPYSSDDDKYGSYDDKW